MQGVLTVLENSVLHALTCTTLNVSGATTLASCVVSGTLIVSGATTLVSATIGALTGGSLTVEGDAVLSSNVQTTNLQATGTSNLTTLSVLGSSTLETCQATNLQANAQSVITDSVVENLTGDAVLVNCSATSYQQNGHLIVSTTNSPTAASVLPAGFTVAMGANSSDLAGTIVISRDGTGVPTPLVGGNYVQLTWKTPYSSGAPAPVTLVTFGNGNWSACTVKTTTSFSTFSVTLLAPTGNIPLSSTISINYTIMLDA